MRKLLTLIGVWLALATQAADQTNPFEKWENEIAAFEAADKASAPPANPVVFVGSSSIRMWSTLAKDFAPLPVLNRGFGGSQVADATHFADRIVLKYHPSEVVLYSGDNDVAAGKSVETVMHDYKEFVKKVHAVDKKLPIVIVSIKPSPSRANVKEKALETNALLKKYCAEEKAVKFVDVWKPMLNDKGEPMPEIFREDKLHMNAQGYEIWTRILKPVVENRHEKQAKKAKKAKA